MFIKIKRKAKSLSHFIWLILLIIITSLVTYFYELNRDTQYKNIKKTLNNIYLQKTFSKINSFKIFLLFNEAIVSIIIIIIYAI